MFGEFRLNPVKARVIVLSIAGVGLVVGTTAFYCQTSRRPEPADTHASAPGGLSVNTGDRLGQNPQTNDNGVTVTVAHPFIERIEDQEAEPAQELNLRRSKKLKSHSSSRRQLASALPVPHFGKPGLDDAGPGSMVEMWSGNKKSVVAVPPGTKFED
jgi:hypothetical protein